MNKPEYIKQLDSRLQVFFDQNEADLTQLQGKTILISGVTGLIGKTLYYLLYSLSEKYELKIKLIGIYRNKEKINKYFSYISNKKNTSIDFIQSDLSSLTINESIDYIIHAASNTSSSSFLKEPVETLENNIKMTSTLLKLAKEKDIQRFLYLSSMEVYGVINKEEKIEEKRESLLSPLFARSSYPISKLACENLTLSYYFEYKVNASILRLTQTLGPGVDKNDKRVFSLFIHNALENKDIILKTEGTTKRSYLHSLDASWAIIVALINGKSGEVYNVASPSSFITIKELAEETIKALKSETKVKFDLNSDTSEYLPPVIYNLDISKLKSIKWEPKLTLKEAIIDTALLSIEN